MNVIETHLTRTGHKYIRAMLEAANITFHESMIEFFEADETSYERTNIILSDADVMMLSLVYSIICNAETIVNILLGAMLIEVNVSRYHKPINSDEEDREYRRLVDSFKSLSASRDVY